LFALNFDKRRRQLYRSKIMNAVGIAEADSMESRVHFCSFLKEHNFKQFSDEGIVHQCSFEDCFPRPYRHRS
jgi:hypothetical protein